MLFHRTRGTVIVHSRDEEEELGGEWSRTLFPPPEPLTEEEQKQLEEGIREFPRWEKLRLAQLKSEEPPPPSPYDPPAPPKRSHKKKV